MKTLRKHIQAGYIGLNKHKFTQAEADRYNFQQDRINAWILADRCPPEIELNYSHKIYCSICGLYK